MKELLIKSIGRTVRLHPRDYLRRKRPCRQLHLPVTNSIPVPSPPAIVDWGRNGTLTFPLDGNSSIGDCEVAACFHQVGLMTGNVGKEVVFSTAQATALYLSLTGGQDTGLSTDTTMAAWTAGLGNLGHRIYDDMAVNPNDSETMQLALWRFGGVFFTLGIPDAWLADPRPGSVWDGGAGVVADDQNGHAVLLSGYQHVSTVGGYDLQTWGFNPPVTITQSGIACCDPEASVVFSPDWYDPVTGYSPAGYHYADDAALWVQLGGNAVPPWSGPTPNPGPGPVVGPAPFHLYFSQPVQAGQRIAFAAPEAMPAGYYTVAPLAAAAAEVLP
jgi:hypothetical protein